MIKRTFLADRAIYSFAAVAMLLALVIPGVFPAFASAAQLQTRSIKISNSTGDASNVSYEISFTASASFQSFVVDVCSDSPIIGQACAATPGFDWGTPTVTGDLPSGALGTITATKVGTTTLKVSGNASVAAGAATFTVTGVHNPTAVGSFYARITTYTDAAFGAGDAYTDAEDVGDSQDDGGIALSTTNSIGVTAAVREKLSFCVSADAPTANEGSCDGMVSPPNLELGEGDTPKALDSTKVSTGTIYTQIATNASAGATVRMTNSNSCGGLHRNGAAVGVCDIAAVNGGANTAGAIAAGNAVFGMKVGTNGFATALSNGTFQAIAPYDDSTNYGMYVDADDGVNSTYGSQVYKSTGPIDDYNAQLNFATSINNSTPAGIYTATLNMVATGTF